jgi:hypothetical protein
VEAESVGQGVSIWIAELGCARQVEAVDNSRAMTRGLISITLAVPTDSFDIDIAAHEGSEERPD